MRNLTLRDPAFVGGSLLSVINTPLFNFPFSGNRTLTDTVSGGSLITFSRAAATGTFFDSSGILQTAAANAARFTTDPLTLVSLGLLGEEQRANSVLWSQVIRLGEWPSQQGTFQAINQAMAPDSTNTASVLSENSQLANRFISQTLAVTNTAHTLSIFAKIKERRRIMFRENSISGAAACFDVALGTVVEVGAGASATITPHLNNWFRCSMTYTPSSVSNRIHAIYLMPDNGTSFATSSYQGDNASGIYLWGAMLEAGALTSYVPTSATAATRNADIADITNANAALIAAIRTLFVEFRSPAVGTRGVLSLNDGTANNRIDIRTSGTAVQVVIVTGGVTQATLAAGTIAANARARLAVRLGTGSFSASLNGAAPVPATGTLPTVDRAAIARTQANEYLNGTIATITAWAQEFTDSMLVSQST